MPHAKPLLLALLLLTHPALADTLEDVARICDEYASPLDPQRPPNIEYRQYHRPEHHERDLQACLTTLEHDPQNPRIAYQLAEVYLERNQYLITQQAIARITENRHGNADVDRDIAHNLAQAKTQLQRAGDYPIARYRLASLEDHSPAQKTQYETLLADAPALAHYALGHWYEEKEPADLEKAREHYRLAADSGITSAQLALSDENTPEHLADLRRIADTSQHPTDQTRLALALYQHGDRAAADAIAEQLRHCPSRNNDCQAYQTRLYIEQYQLDHGTPPLSHLNNLAASGDHGARLSYAIILDQREQIEKQYKQNEKISQP